MPIRRLAGYLRQRFRRQRYQDLRARLGLDAVTGPILDLGGGPASFFAALYPDPQQIVLLEIEPELARRARSQIAGLQVVIADGTRLPFADQSMSLTVCNSVIEHVDAPDRLATEIQRVSRAYFVQTPNVQFPLETHSYVAIPFYRQLPGARLRRLACFLFRADYAYVESVRYLSASRLRALFPDAQMRYERFLGLVKSFYLIAR